MPDVSRQNSNGATGKTVYMHQVFMMHKTEKRVGSDCVDVISLFNLPSKLARAKNLDLGMAWRLP